MPDTPSSPERPGGEGWAAGIAVLAMVGCCGAPLLIALASSVAIGTLLGVGGGILAAIALCAIAITTTRRRRSCATPRTPTGRRCSGPPAANPHTITPRKRAMRQS